MITDQNSSGTIRGKVREIMKKELRKQVILSMETIAKQINDEDVLELWLLGGVADGDVQEFDPDQIDDWYLQDENFKGIMDCFLRCMKRAYKSGGLYCDKVLTKEGNQ